MSTRRAALRALAFYVAVAVAFAPDAAIGRGVFWSHDLRHHHDPWRAWAAAAWTSESLPWWTSGAGNGFPLLSEGEGGFLYPPTMLLYLLLPGPLALDWSVLGHQVLAAMGLWAFLRARGLRGAAPILGGLAFAWGGFLVSHTLYLGMQNAAAWLGWGLFAAATGRTWLVALAIGMMGLAGHPQAAAFGGLLLAGHAFVSGAGRRWILGALVGAVIASPQLIATLELVRESARDGGVDEAFAHIGALPLPELIKAVLPYAFGFDRPADVTQTYYHRGTGYWGPGVNSWETTFYLGIPVVILALLGARRARGWAILAVVATVLMLGGPAWELVRQLPGFGGFRFPARFALWLSLAVSVLAAFGLDRLDRREHRVRGWIAWTLAVFTLCTGLTHFALRRNHDLLTDVAEGAFRARAEHRVAPPPPSDPVLAAALPPVEQENPAAIPAKVWRILADLRDSTSPVSPRVLVPVGLLLGTALLARRKRALVLLVAADLWWFGHDLHPRTPASVARTPPRWLSDAMTEPGGFRTTVLDRRIDPALDTEALSASLGLLWGTNDVLLPSPLLMPRNDALLSLAGLDIGGRGAVHVRRYLENLDVARRLGVRWVASVHEIPGLVPLVRGPVNLYQDPGALPRVRMVPCVDGVATSAEALAALPGTDPRQAVIVEGWADGCGAGGDARMLTYREQFVEVEATGPGTLVLADTWYPRWVATLDDAPVEIGRADLTLRAVAVPEGRHLVTFRYDPGLPSHALFVALLALIGVGVGGYLRERRPR